MATTENPADSTPRAAAEVTHDVYCHVCGYSLRALTSRRCPECGTPVGEGEAAAVPWAQRSVMGRCDAYFRTAQVALMTPQRLGEAGARPVSFMDASLFRWVTVLVAWPIQTLLLAIFVNTLPASAWLHFGLLWSPAPTIGGAPPVPPAWLTPLIMVGSGRHAWLAMALALLPVLLLATAPPAIFFRRRDRGRGAYHRLITVGTYPACTGVALITAVSPVIHLGVWAVGLIDGYGVTHLQPIAFVAAPLMSLALVVAWSGTTARVLGRASQASTSRTVTAAVVWPLAVGLVAAVCMVAAVYLYGVLLAIQRSL